MTLAYTIGSGPILRQFQMATVFNGDLFSISGGELYRNSTLIGAVPYGPNPRMVAAGSQLAIVAGGALYVYDGTTLTLVTLFNDGESTLPSFSGVAVLYNIFIYPVAGSNEFYFSQVGDASSIGAANFSEAQTSPDAIIEVQVLAEELMFFKATAVEFWDFTGGLTAPFAESPGRTYIRGTPAQGSVVKLDNAMFWVGDDLSVYRSGAVPTKISTPFIDDRLQKAGGGAAQITSFDLGIEGHNFYVMNIPTLNESYAYDGQTEEWAQWGTQNLIQAEPALLQAATAATVTGEESSIMLGSATDGRIWTADVNNHTDDGLPIRVVVDGAIWMRGGYQRCNTVSLACVRGVGNAGNPGPFAEMRFSDDGGRTFTSWLSADLGPVGDYYYKPTWRALGTMQQPGRLFEFSVSDSVPFVVEAASINEARV